MYELDEEVGDYALDLPPAIDNKREDVIILQELNEDTPFEEGVEVLEALLNDRDKLFGHILQLQEMQEFGVTEKTRQVVAESALFRKQLEKRYFGGPGYTFASEAIYYVGDVRRVLATEAEESKGIFARMWEAIKSAFRWLLNAFKKLFGMQESGSSKDKKSIEEASEKAEDLEKKEKEIEEKAQKQGVSPSELKAKSEKLREKARDGNDTWKFEKGSRGELLLKASESLSKILSIPGEDKIIDSGVLVENFRNQIKAHNTLTGYTKVMEDVLGQCLTIQKQVTENLNGDLKPFYPNEDLYKQLEDAAAGFKEKKIDKGEYDLIGNAAALIRASADTPVRCIDGLYKNALFVFSKVTAEVDLSSGSYKAPLPKYEYVRSKNNDHVSKIEVFSWDKDTPLILKYYDAIDKFSKNTKESRLAMEKTVKLVLQKPNIEEVLKDVDATKPGAMKDFTAIVRYYTSMERELAAAWQAVTKSLLDTQRYSRALARFMVISVELVEQKIKSMEKTLNLMNSGEFEKVMASNEPLVI